MLIRFTKNISGNVIGEVKDLPRGQADFIIEQGNAIPVQQGPDGRIIMTRGGRKIPRRDRTETANEQVDTID